MAASNGRLLSNRRVFRSNQRLCPAASSDPSADFSEDDDVSHPELRTGRVIPHSKERIPKTKRREQISLGEILHFAQDESIDRVFPNLPKYRYQLRLVGTQIPQPDSDFSK